MKTINSPSEIFKAAMLYESFGWAVIPIHAMVNGLCTCGRDDCDKPGKHPRVAWMEYMERKPSHATLKEWFGEEFYGANLAVITGEVSDILVVDCDGPTGIRNARELGNSTFTLTSRTGGGGLHQFYRVSGSKVPTRIGALPKVDIKGERGYVVLPPSLHASGRQYSWRFWTKAVHCDLRELELPPISTNTANAWYTELLDGVDQGGRSNAATKLIGRYLNMGLTQEETWWLLVSWNLRNRPPQPERELKATLKSMVRKHENTNPELVETLNDLQRMLVRLA